MSFQFQNPMLLLLLLLVPLVLVRYFRKGRLSVRFSSISTLKKIPASRVSYMRWLLPALRALSVACIVIALARPQVGVKFSEILSEGVDIILALDTSGSMKALDFKLKGKRTERINVVKNVVREFIKGRANDRMGMIVFGEEAYTQCPLTLDHGVLLSFLDKVKIGMAGDSTAIGSAVGVAVNRLKDLKAKSKIVVLLTDGRSNAGSLQPEKAAEIASTFGIKVYTIGVGTKGQVPISVDTPIFGKQIVYQPLDLDENTIKKIAEITGARYFRAQNTDALKDIYKQIDKLEKSEVKVKEYMNYNEYFMYFLVLAMVLLVLEVILANTRFLRVP